MHSEFFTFFNNFKFINLNKCILKVNAKNFHKQSFRYHLCTYFSLNLMSKFNSKHEFWIAVLLQATILLLRRVE